MLSIQLFMTFTNFGHVMKRSRDGEIVKSPDATVSITCVGFLTTTSDPGGVDTSLGNYILGIRKQN